MRRFNVKVRVVQEVEKEINFNLDAIDEEDIPHQVEKALETYPQAVMTSSIHRIYTPKIHYNPPTEIEYLLVTEEKRFA